MKPPRFLYIPNEHREGDQIGPRKAFKLLHERGVLSAYTTYSYLVKRKSAASQEAALQDLYLAASEFKPDVIFWQHLNNSYPVEREFLRRLKSIASHPKLVWHDPDPYGRIIKPIDQVMRNAIAESDIAVVKGLGYFAEEVRKAGARCLLYSPESVDDERFGTPWEQSRERKYNALMIANLTCLKRIPWLFLPGGRNRKKMSRLFHRAYGERYAVFGGGQGWKGEPYCKGPIAFNDQEAAIRSAWISVNWSQFDEIPMYFSDRLPISLAAGVPHITNYQRGFEHVLPDAKGVYFVHSPEEALDVADYLLSLPKERLIEIGQSGVEYVRNRLNATQIYADLVDAICHQISIAPKRHE